MTYKVNELSGLSDQELQEKVIAMREDIFSLRVKQANGALSNGTRIRELRRGIARALTTVRQRQLKTAQVTEK